MGDFITQIWSTSLIQNRFKCEKDIFIVRFSKIFCI